MQLHINNIPQNTGGKMLLKYDPGINGTGSMTHFAQQVRGAGTCHTGLRRRTGDLVREAGINCTGTLTHFSGRVRGGGTGRTVPCESIRPP